MKKEDLAECEKCKNLVGEGQKCRVCGTYMPTGDDLADEGLRWAERRNADLCESEEY